MGIERKLFKDLPLDKKTATLALLQSVEEKETKGGKPYCRLTLSDGENVIEANLWNNAKADLKVEEKTLVAVELYPKIYNDAVGYEVHRYGPYNGDEFSLKDFIIMAPIDVEVMYDEILSLVEKNDSTGLSGLVKEIYEENKEKLLYWSAAKAVHHNCYGGLLYHTTRMIRSGIMLSKVYTDANLGILLPAIALHDIGKLLELETDMLGVAEYSVEGTLFSHMLIGIEMVNKYADGYDPEAIRMLKHCIAAHHGKLEWGAIAVPATPEAMLLHQIDMIDAQMYQYENALKDMDEPGGLSDKIFGLGTKVYKSTL